MGIEKTFVFNSTSTILTTKGTKEMQRKGHRGNRVSLLRYVVIENIESLSKEKSNI